MSAIRGLAFAAGCNAHGVSGSAGLAMQLVESLSGDPSPYVRSLSPDRFVPATWSWEDARREAQAVYETITRCRRGLAASAQMAGCMAVRPPSTFTVMPVM